MYTEKFLTINGNVVHYLDNDSQSSNLIVIFPPGIQDARFVQELELISLERIICLSYSSRYKSSILNEFNSLENIANICVNFLKIYLKENDIQNVKLVGFSFGTAVITKIVDKQLEFNISDIILINAGEFFNKFVNFLLKLVFFPALRSNRYAKFLKFVLTKLTKIFNPEYFPDNRLIQINEQWISTLDHMVDTKRKVSIHSVFMDANFDKVIANKSLNKLKTKFKDAEFIDYQGNHIFSYKNSLDYLKIREILHNKLKF